MASGGLVAKKYRRLRLLNLAALTVIGILAAISAGKIAYSITEQQLRAATRETLAVQTEALTGMLEKYRLLPALLSRQADIRNAFSPYASDPTLNAAEDAVRTATGLSGALNISLLHTDGRLISHGAENIFDPIAEGSPLLVAALQGRLGREVRTMENGDRAYVFTAGVRSGRRIVGIIAVYAGLDPLEAAWSLSTDAIIAVDVTKTIIISNRGEWQNQPLNKIRDVHDDQVFYKTKNIDRQYIETTRELPLLNWRLSVLADAQPIRAATAFWISATLITIAILALSIQTYLNRRLTIERAARRDRATALRLERIVRDRTADLSRTNKSLELEIEEHRTAEVKLREAQNELIQTGKLAALGQMSTALSHEYNQPLAAIKSYAENATTFLSRGRENEALANIGHIVELTDRMADISRHLRNFARKPNITYGSVPLDTVVADTLNVIAMRIRAENAIVENNIATQTIWVRAGHVRLQQVLLNLILNALDANEGNKPPVLKLSAIADAKKVRINIADNGPGIAPEVLDKIFDPFFTTKGVGKGLGLGLSISYNIIKDFEGDLAAKNSPDGGAVFTITLKAGTRAAKAAE